MTKPNAPYCSESSAFVATFYAWCSKSKAIVSYARDLHQVYASRTVTGILVWGPVSVPGQSMKDLFHKKQDWDRLSLARYHSTHSPHPFITSFYSHCLKCSWHTRHWASRLNVWHFYFAFWISLVQTSTATLANRLVIFVVLLSLEANVGTLGSSV